MYNAVYQKQYRLKNKAKLLSRESKWRKRNRLRIYKYQKLWYKNNKDKYKVYAKRYAVKNHDKLLAHVKTYRSEHPDKVRVIEKRFREKYKERLYRKRRQAYCKATYGITLEQKEEMIVKQQNKCLICNHAFSDAQHTHVDHDHITKKVRGILCSSCNCMLAFSKDNINILKSGIKYLKKSRCKQYAVPLGGKTR